MNFGFAKQYFVGGDGDVAEHRQFTPAAKRVALDRCDHGLAHVPRCHLKVEIAAQAVVPDRNAGGRTEYRLGFWFYQGAKLHGGHLKLWCIGDAPNAAAPSAQRLAGGGGVIKGWAVKNYQ